MFLQTSKNIDLPGAGRIYRAHEAGQEIIVAGLRAVRSSVVVAQSLGIGKQGDTEQPLSPNLQHILC